jgi:hypothetical protein
VLLLLKFENFLHVKNFLLVTTDHQKMKQKDKVLFVGCGTGRCGTTSLARLIDGCEDAVCTHERRPLLPWVFNEDLFQERVRWFADSTAGITGDVAYFYLPYLEKLIDVFPDLKVVYLERNRQAVIDSFMWKTPWQNRWFNHDGNEWVKDDVWDPTFPKYTITDKAQAIGAYWDDYRKSVMRFARRFPAKVLSVQMEELNTSGGQRRILGFLGIPEESRRYMDKPRFNARQTKGRPWSKEEALRWMQRQSLAAADISSLIRPGTEFILVDEELIVDYLPPKFRAVPFLERDGVYWGPPPDDATAIRELDRLRQSGARFIVFAWTAFWWLDYYVGFRDYLRSNYRCLIENDRIAGFDLVRKI